jgi:hypothetical protein
MRVSVPEVPERRFPDRVDPPRVPGMASAGSSTRPQWFTASLTPSVLPRISVDSSDVNSRPKAAVLPQGEASALKGLNVPPEQWFTASLTPLVLPRISVDSSDVNSRPKAAVLPQGGASALKGLNVPPEQLQMPQPKYPEIFMPRFRDDPDDVVSPDRSPRSQSTPELRPDDGGTPPR